MGSFNDYIFKKLQESYKVLTIAQELAQIGSWKLDMINNRSICSEECYRIYGITPDQYDGTYGGFIKYVHPEDVPMVQALFQNTPTKPLNMDYRIVRPDGAIRYVHQRVMYQFDNKGAPTAIYGTIQDITKEKELKKKIQEKQVEIMKTHRKFQALVQKSSDVFEIIAADGTIVYLSNAAEKIIGYRPEERVGNKVFDYYTGNELKKLNKMIDLALEHPAKDIQGNLIFKNKEGKEVYLECHMQNFLDDPWVDGIVVNFRDITRRINVEKMVAHISTHDDLTGLPNRKYLMKKLRLQRAYANKTNTQFALMMLDFEGLKYINYSFGYELGNTLIKKIVTRLKVSIGEEYFLCRYSDDHFAIIVHGLKTYEEYEDFAKLMIHSFSEPFQVEKYEIDVTINVGICIYPWEAQDIDSLRKYSKTALLRAKKEGKNRYRFYSSDFDNQNYKEFILRSDLHHAIDKNQLVIHFQPIIQLNTNRIIGAEALIRWEHPKWGIIPPSEFIYMAEETGYIINIGKWLLQEVCHTYKQWMKEGYSNLKISINYSAIQFFENSFTEKIIDIIKEYQIDPHFLIMEITESILMKNPEKAIPIIQQLQSYGIQVAVDDFGTGYSSLAYLKSFKIDILKLDGSFIKDLKNDKVSNIITKSMINMSKELGIKIVAEGIENWSQLTMLKELTCYSGQGFLFSAPLSRIDFKGLLSKGICEPNLSDSPIDHYNERRQYYRIQLHHFLEACSTIKEVNSKSIETGLTKVLIRDIGPGGLRFITNLNFPLDKNLILKFSTQLIGEEIEVHGRIVWAKESNNQLFENGVEFTIDENDRDELVRILNKVQARMRKELLFDQGSFVTCSPVYYFNHRVR